MPGAVRPFHRLEERNNGKPTDICLRLMEGADIYQIAGNCRTSVEMIGKILRLAHRDHPGCGGDQRPQGTAQSAPIGPNRSMAEPATPSLRNIDAWTSCCRLGAAIL
jgi:hypothetical protein